MNSRKAETIDVTLRCTVTVRDIPGIQRILEHTEAFKPHEITVALELTEEWITKGDGSGYHFIIAEHHGEIAGYVCYGPITMTTRRNLKVAFVGPYFTSGKAFLTKKRTIAAVKEGADLNRPNVTVTALKGSTSQEFVEAVMPRAKFIPAKTYDEAVAMVIEDKVDAMVADYAICVVSVFRYPDKGLVSIITPLTYEPIGIALNADDSLLLNLVQNFLNTLETSGQMKEMKKRWFGNGSWLYQLK